MTQWNSELHARIAEAIRAARGGRSAQWLADRTGQLGYPVSRAAIANYESGRKKGLDVAELLVIAAALEVPPIALLYPALPNGPVESLPGNVVPSLVAAEWFSGEVELLDSRLEHPKQPAKVAELVRASRTRAEVLRSAHQFEELYQKLHGGGGTPWEESDSGIRVRNEIARLEAQILAAGGVLDA